MDAVYIHIPFCSKICSYCDFCKIIYNTKWVMPYLKSLSKEIDDKYNGEDIKTLYIGGGTPSHLSYEELNYLFEIIKKFKLDKLEEFTFECNVSDISSELLTILKNNNVNRLSIGIESFDKNKLAFMNRDNSFEYAKRQIELCRSFGFSNINLDLIYGIPKETIKVLTSDIKHLIELKPEHISTYSLIIEDNTMISFNKVNPIDSDLDFEMYDRVCKMLEKSGYNHYEISNFSKSGYESKHNINYWKNNKYYGFGLGASGYIENIRYENTRSLDKYINNEYRLKEELLSIEDDMDNFIMLGFRLTKGVNLQDFYDRYKINLQEKYDIKQLLKDKKLLYKDGYLMINPKYLYVMNEILINIL